MFDSVGKPETTVRILEKTEFSTPVLAFFMSQSHGIGCSGNPGVLLKLAQSHEWLEFFTIFSSLVSSNFLKTLR
jgi:hypothetical protein